MCRPGLNGHSWVRKYLHCGLRHRYSPPCTSVWSNGCCCLLELHSHWLNMFVHKGLYMPCALMFCSCCMSCRMSNGFCVETVMVFALNKQRIKCWFRKVQCQCHSPPHCIPCSILTFLFQWKVWVSEQQHPIPACQPVKRQRDGGWQ